MEQNNLKLQDVDLFAIESDQMLLTNAEGRASKNNRIVDISSKLPSNESKTK